MKDRPILFSGPMVKVILEGRKTQTRRLVKPNYLACLTGDCPHQRQAECNADLALACTYGEPGDRLWVRESCWLKATDVVVGYRPESGERTEVEFCGERGVSLEEGEPPHVWYAADGPLPEMPEWTMCRWERRNSIHMPRWACRLELEVTAIRVERLHDISEEDAKAEGVPPMLGSPEPVAPAYRDGFRQLLDALNGNRAPWASSPWVWVVSFRKLEST